ncbi:M20 metallopeptidase family protein [Croceivirga thetidis]|uniref:Amidohydrolase n=1 Tax=Croceivirga thetidis TaxID=2721623 RepID=A0ABX1GKF6_9FLAO|nr:M20 family metallopeptidase [Croceivirga thetidis]NKI30395.1 amidohydrolase [Croceivirga thetidis]
MKFKLVITFFILLFSISNDSIKHLRSNEKIANLSREIFDELIAIRNDLHDHPELAGKEKRTAKIVEDYLLNLGLEVKTGIGGYGVVGILNGNKKGKKIAWRADMDAALHVFDNKLNHKPQVAHICGHDVHTTIALGMANVLSKCKADIQGTVYFIFQPAEESFEGAKSMLEDGLFEEIQTDEIFGLHVFPTEIGSISSKPNELFAYQRRIKLTFENTIEQDAFSDFFQKILEGLVRHKTNTEPWSLDFLTDPQNGLSNPNTIYSDYFILGSTIATRYEKNTTSFECTYYETDAERLDRITDTVINSEFGEFYINTSFTAERPTVMNDPKLTSESISLLKGLHGKENVNLFYGQMPYSNEDFIYYQNKKPGVMFLLGASNHEKGIYALPHTSEFEVDEEVIKIGVYYFSTFLAEKINTAKS